MGKSAISVFAFHKNNRTTFGGKRQNDEKKLVENGKTAKKIWWKTAKPLFLQ